MLSGAEIDEWDSPGLPRTLLSVDGVGKKFAVARRWFWARPRSFCPLSSASFEVVPGRVVGIVGAAGSGKSVLAGILAGEVAADWGQLRFEGEAVGGPALAVERYRAAVRLVTDDRVAPEPALVNPDIRVVVLDGDAAARRHLGSFGRGGDVGCVALVRDAAVLAGAADQTLRLLDGRLSSATIGRAVN